MNSRPLVFPASNHMRPNEKAQGREICQIIDGMLNTDGGTLYIGVSNTGSHVGLHPDFVYLSKGRDDYDLADVKDKFELFVLQRHAVQYRSAVRRPAAA